MPIYTYRCRRCGAEFDQLLLSTTWAAEVACPACRSREVERRPTLFGLRAGKGEKASAEGSCRPAVGGG